MLLAPERPAVFLRSLEDAVGEEQGEVCLQCGISKETVSPIWMKDGMVLTADDKHEFLQFGKSLTLVVHSLSKDDAGQYTCVLGTSQTTAKVTVHGELALGGILQELYILKSSAHIKGSSDKMSIKSFTEHLQ